MNRKSVVTIAIICLCLTALSGAEDQPKRVMNFLAVMDLKCGTGIEKDQCAALTDVLIDEMVKMKKYTIIDRANRDKILSEAGFQQTGCVEESCTIEMGRQLGVGKMIVGTITKLEETYLVSLQLLNVETSAVENSARETCEKCKLDNLLTTITNTAHKLMGEAPAAPQTSTEEQMAVDTQKIADSGLFPTYQPAKAMVIFFRPKESLKGKLKISVDGKIIGELPDGCYFIYETDSGIHELAGTLTIMGIRGTKSLVAKLLAGKTIFVRIADNGLTIVNPDTGLKQAKSCQYKAPEAGK